MATRLGARLDTTIVPSLRLARHKYRADQLHRQPGWICRPGRHRMAQEPDAYLYLRLAVCRRHHRDRGAGRGISITDARQDNYNQWVNLYLLCQFSLNMM